MTDIGLWIALIGVALMLIGQADLPRGPDGSVALCLLGLFSFLPIGLGLVLAAIATRKRAERKGLLAPRSRAWLGVAVGIAGIVYYGAVYLPAFLRQLATGF